MKKLIVGLTLVAFLVAGAVSMNTVKANSSSLDLKIDKVQVDKDPTKEKDKDKKKDSKTTTTTKTTKSTEKSSNKDACSEKNTSCSGQKTSCCSKSKPDKK